jgi:hypothetical protein
MFLICARISTSTYIYGFVAVMNIFITRIFSNSGTSAMEESEFINFTKGYLHADPRVHYPIVTITRGISISNEIPSSPTHESRGSLLHIPLARASRQVAPG